MEATVTIPPKIPKPQIKYIGRKGEYSDKVSYSTISECLEYCKDKKELSVDIETTKKFPKGTYNESVYQGGLDPYMSSVIMLQIGDLKENYVIDTRTEDISMLLPLFQDKERVWVGANLRFEAKHLQYNYSILFHKICDVMLQEQNLTNGLGKSKDNPNGLRYSLEAMAGRYLGIEAKKQKDLFSPEEEEDVDQVYIDKSIRMGFLTIGDKLFTEEQILYGADDILYPIMIKKLQENGYKGYKPTEVHDLENEFCLVLADIELKGITFDKDQWLRMYEQSNATYQNRLNKLNAYVIKEQPKFCKVADLFNPNKECDIEWSSSKQVIKLFKHLEICPQEKSKQTKRMEYTVGAKSLLKLLPTAYKELYNNDEETDIAEQKDLILNYLLFKTAEQAVTTFGKDWLKYIHPITGKIHSTYKQILNTGRISSNNPNCQNIPGGKGYRMAFIAAEGNILINSDFASQESRCVAELSGDIKMISFFNDGHPVHGDDFHSFVGTAMFSLMRNDPNLIISKKSHPKERNDAKNTSFKTVYGGSAYTMKDDFGVEEEVAQQFIDSYLDAFPSLRNHFETGRKAAEKEGYIDILPDRRYWESSFEHMQELKAKAWSYYPKDYSKMKQAERDIVKAKLKKDHPELGGIWKEYMTLLGELSRASQNYKVQGLAGAQTKLAGILFRRYQIENNLRDKVWLSNLIHDEACAETIYEYTEEARQLVEKCMEEGAQHYCKKVKMKAEAIKTPYWTH